MALFTEEMGSQSFCDENFETLLIPGLPDDLAMLCLVRLPRKYHHILRGVCKKWRSFLTSHLFAALREKLRLSEGWVYVLSRDSSEYLHWHVLDPSQRRWMALPGMPDACSRRFGMACEVLDRQLYLIGGCGKYEDPTNEVHVFDALQHRWKEVAHMDLARCYLVSGALAGKVYAIGGSETTPGALTSWEIYDPHIDQWLSYDDPSIVQDVGESLVLDGKIFVRHVSPTNDLFFYAATYDPVNNSWTLLDDEMTRWWYGQAVVVGEDTYMLDQTSGVKLLSLDKAKNCWDPVGRISPRSIRTPCRMAVVGSMLFLVGRGLKVLVLDMEKARKSKGLLVTTSVMGLQSPADNVVIWKEMPNILEDQLFQRPVRRSFQCCNYGHFKNRPSDDTPCYAKLNGMLILQCPLRNSKLNSRLCVSCFFFK